MCIRDSGGTEYMGYNFHKRIVSSLPKLDDYLCLMAPGNTPSFANIVQSEKPILFWMHNTPQQFGNDKIVFLKNKKFIEKIKYVIVLSEKHKEYTLDVMPLKEEQVYIIGNGVEPLTYSPHKFKDVGQVKLVHTSTAERGLDILLESLKYVDEDIRVEVYNDFYPDLQEEREYDSRVRFFGKTPKRTVLEAIESSHIHAYPSTYPETFCISQVEAMSAGLLCVTSDLGSLPDVSHNYTSLYPYTEDKEKHIKIFAEKLTQAIQRVKAGQWDPTAQIEYVNSTYSWEAIKKKWLEFHELL